MITLVKTRELQAVTKSIPSQGMITSSSNTSQLLYSVSSVNIFQWVSTETPRSMFHKSSDHGRCEGGHSGMVMDHNTSEPISGSANGFRRMNLSRRRNSVYILMNIRKRRSSILHEHPPSITIGISLMININFECL
jgi:hypothetical protein